MTEITDGSITIDGLDISTVPRHYIRARLNAIGEDPFFMTGSLRLNLDPYDNTTDEQMRSALEKVGLWSAIEAKGGLDAEFASELLSHGQMQIFCLARALLRPGKIVVMDEISSAVDREADALMQEVIRKEFKDKTVITVAHRVDTVIDYDKVAVLGEGKLVEYGSPDQLMVIEGGIFRGLVERGL